MDPSSSSPSSPLHFLASLSPASSPPPPAAAASSSGSASSSSSGAALASFGVAKVDSAGFLVCETCERRFRGKQKRYTKGPGHECQKCNEKDRKGRSHHAAASSSPPPPLSPPNLRARDESGAAVVATSLMASFVGAPAPRPLTRDECMEAATRTIPLAEVALRWRPEPDEHGSRNTPAQTCVFIDKATKQQCEVKTSYGCYCDAHMRSELGLYLAPSTIPGVGMGLFSARAFAPGERIAEYSGDEIVLDETNDTGGPYVLAITKTRGVDAARTNTGYGRWANSPLLTGKAWNSCLVAYKGAGCLRARKRHEGGKEFRGIKKDEEILTRYGKDYEWKHTNKNDFDDDDDDMDDASAAPAAASSSSSSAAAPAAAAASSSSSSSSPAFFSSSHYKSHKWWIERAGGAAFTVLLALQALVSLLSPPNKDVKWQTVAAYKKGRQLDVLDPLVVPESMRPQLSALYKAGDAYCRDRLRRRGLSAAQVDALALTAFKLLHAEEGEGGQELHCDTADKAVAEASHAFLFYGADTISTRFPVHTAAEMEPVLDPTLDDAVYDAFLERFVGTTAADESLHFISVGVKAGDCAEFRGDVLHSGLATPHKHARWLLYALYMPKVVAETLTMDADDTQFFPKGRPSYAKPV